MSRLSNLAHRLEFEWRYLRGNTPWDTRVTPPELVNLIERERLPRGRALDIGCGSGTNVIYLARHGFQVTGLDFVLRIVAHARERLRAEGLDADLRVADVTRPLDLGLPFDLVLDIGCLHSLPPGGRRGYRENLVRWTRSGATVLLYAFYPRRLDRDCA